MNISNRRIVWVLLLCLPGWGTLAGQAGFNVKAGAESWSLKDEKEQTGQSCHPGQMFGFDVLLEKNRALFMPGFHYHRISVENEDKCFDFSFSDAHHMHYITIPLTGGYKVLDKPDLDISLLGGAEVNFFYDLDDNDVGIDDDGLYGIFTALTGIVHTEFFSLVTLEVRYHYALQPIIKVRDDSKLRGWTFALGLKF